MRSGRTGTPEPITGVDDLGLIHRGDLQQGAGVSTAQLGRVTVSPFGDDRAARSDAHDAAGKSAFQNIVENALNKKRSGGGSLGVWLVFLVLLVLVKYFAEKSGEASEFSSVRIGLENWFVVGALSLTFAYMFKVGSALLPNTGWAAPVREFAGAS